MTASYIKLKNGDQIVSNINQINDKLIMEKPLEIHIMSDFYNGKPMVNLMEWISTPFVNTQIFEISIEEVLIVVPASQELNDFYVNTLQKINLFRENKRAMGLADKLLDDTEEQQSTSKTSKKYLH